jgi:tRNA (guanosine-2'-O-)-methyltransferase
MREDDPQVSAPEPLRPLPADADAVIATLDPLLTDARRARIDAVLAARTRAVTLVLDGLIDPHNVSAVLRSADAFGVQRVHLVERDTQMRLSRRITQGCERWLEIMHHEDTTACLRWLHEHGYRVLVASMDGEAPPESLPDVPRLAIVFGNEHAGPSDAARAGADGTYAIPMRGFVESLNVSVAAAITLQQAMRGRSGDLDVDDRHALRARFLLTAVPRAEEILAAKLASP